MVCGCPTQPNIQPSDLAAYKEAQRTTNDKDGRRLDAVPLSQFRKLTELDSLTGNDFGLQYFPPLTVALLGEDKQQVNTCLSSEDYIFVTPDEDGSQFVCVPSVQRLAAGTFSQDMMILGMSYMRSYYTTFDMGGDRIGLVRSKAAVNGGAKCDARTIRESMWSQYLSQLRKGGE